MEDEMLKKLKERYRALLVEGHRINIGFGLVSPSELSEKQLKQADELVASRYNNAKETERLRLDSEAFAKAQANKDMQSDPGT